MVSGQYSNLKQNNWSQEESTHDPEANAILTVTKWVLLPQMTV
jgi:hypothetical protein